MKVFTCNNFYGHYPVGSAAVVVADDVNVAKQMLLDELRRVGLDPGDRKLEMIQVHTSKPRVIILVDGDY